MSTFSAKLRWQRKSDDFQYKTFDRQHTWGFPGGQSVTGSAAPEYLGNANDVNPEEALIASISSCHMLTFLAYAAIQQFTVDSYDDEPCGTLGKNADGRMAVTDIYLKPDVVFSGDKQPNETELSALHDKAHRDCFIANTVNCTVHVNPV